MSFSFAVAKGGRGEVTLQTHLASIGGPFRVCYRKVSLLKTLRGEGGGLAVR